MTHYSLIRAVVGGGTVNVILQAAGNDQDGKQWPDTDREPELGVFQLPTDEPERDRTLASMFMQLCLATGKAVFVAFDDAGNSKAWWYTGDQ